MTPSYKGNSSTSNPPTVDKWLWLARIPPVGWRSVRMLRGPDSSVRANETWACRFVRFPNYSFTETLLHNKSIRREEEKRGTPFGNIDNRPFPWRIWMFVFFSHKCSCFYFLFTFSHLYTALQLFRQLHLIFFLLFAFKGKTTTTTTGKHNPSSTAAIKGFLPRGYDHHSNSNNIGALPFHS